jgi:hypothetical protein
LIVPLTVSRKRYFGGGTVIWLLLRRRGNSLVDVLL